jgi:hypothetical protein
VKVIYYLPAHPSYFSDDTYTQEQVDRAISLFRLYKKPGMLGEIPEEFVFLTEPGKTVTAKLDSTDMGAPDEKTEQRWLQYTMEFAHDELNRLLPEIRSWVRATKRKPQGE